MLEGVGSLRNQVEKEKRMELEKKRVLLQCTESIRKLLSKMNEAGITERQKEVGEGVLSRGELMYV